MSKTFCVRCCSLRTTGVIREWSISIFHKSRCLQKPFFLTKFSLVHGYLLVGTKRAISSVSESSQTSRTARALSVRNQNFTTQKEPRKYLYVEHTTSCTECIPFSRASTASTTGTRESGEEQTRGLRARTDSLDPSAEQPFWKIYRYQIGTTCTGYLKTTHSSLSPDTVHPKRCSK